MTNIRQSAELVLKTISEAPGVCKQVDGKTVEQNYNTPYLGYPYYSAHDELIHNFYHNDDCPPMRGFYHWHIQDPICFDEDLRVTIQQMGLDTEDYLSVRMTWQVLHTGIRHILTHRSRH